MGGSGGSAIGAQSLETVPPERDRVARVLDAELLAISLLTDPAAATTGDEGACALGPLPMDALPHPPGRLPIVGDVAGVDRHRPVQHELKLAHRGLGPVFGRKLLGTQPIILAGGRLAAQCNDEAADDNQ